MVLQDRFGVYGASGYSVETLGYSFYQFVKSGEDVGGLSQQRRKPILKAHTLLAPDAGKVEQLEGYNLVVINQNLPHANNPFVESVEETEEDEEVFGRVKDNITVAFLREESVAIRPILDQPVSLFLIFLLLLALEHPLVFLRPLGFLLRHPLLHDSCDFLVV